jgi:hypothetical protein
MFEQAFVTGDIVWGIATGPIGPLLGTLEEPAVGRTNRNDSEGR